MKSKFFSVALWLMLWLGYNANFWRVFAPGFPNNLVDLLQGVRTFFPIIAGIFALLFLLAKKHLSSEIIYTPLGLMLLYVFWGMVGGIFSTQPQWALYWALAFGSVLTVLLFVLKQKKALKNLSLIIKTNWFIFAFLSLVLALFFFIQPGVLKSLTPDFLICNQRPYEHLAGVPTAITTFGMAGTRPIGLARYAGAAAVFLLIWFLYSKNKQRILYFLLLLFFIFILLFSKGKTELVAFICTGIFALFLVKKKRILATLPIALVAIVSVFVIFFYIPCGTISFSTNQLSVVEQTKTNIPVAQEQPQEQLQKTEFNKGILTLSGRIYTWSDAWKVFLTSPLIGLGFQADRYFLDGWHAHNTVLHALLQAGLLGTIPFVTAIIITFFYLFGLFKNKNVEEKEKQFLVLISAALVFFLIRGIMESLAFYSADWLFTAPIIAYIQLLYFNINNKSKNP